MNGFLKRELPATNHGRHFEFLRKADGEIVELTASTGFTGSIPDPTVLVNAHINAATKNGQMVVEQLVIVS